MNNLDKNRYIQIGLKIAYYRKLNNWTQEQLAEKIGRSTGYLSQVETPNFVQAVSLKTLFVIADAFQISPYKLLLFDRISEEKKYQSNTAVYKSTHELTFQTRLKNLRKSKGYTQEQLADKLSIDRSTYSYYETGTTQPNIKYLIELSAILNVTIDDLVGNNRE